MLSDRHVHTPYCLHGSSDAMENYVKVAIEAGLESRAFDTYESKKHPESPRGLIFFVKFIG